MKKRNILKSGGLILILLLIFYINIGLNITGVSVKKEKMEEELIELIHEDYPQAEQFLFFDFDRSVVICHDRSWIRVFDLDGKLLETRLASGIDIAKSREHFIGYEDATISLGYAYGELVYSLKESGVIWLLDIEDFSTVFYYEEGE